MLIVERVSWVRRAVRVDRASAAENKKCQDKDYDDEFAPTPRHFEPESNRWKLAQEFPEGAEQTLNDERLVVDGAGKFILPIVDVVSHVVPHRVVNFYQRHCTISRSKYHVFATGAAP